jgi:DNA-binding winged helix-turn-helix (wHTH) protein/tetratricopeptide (TPR) repeat protein
MQTSSPKAVRYRFGPFELDPGDGSLSRNHVRVKLQDLPFRLLVMLVERPGEVITREEVRQRLWAENTFVEFDNSLGVAIRKVRDSLGDDAEAPRYVETVPRRGYRFLAPVSIERAEATDFADAGKEVAVADAANGSAIASTGAIATTRNRFRILATAALLLVLAAAYGLRFVSRRHASKANAASAIAPVRMRRSVAVLGFRNLPGHPEDNWLSPAFAEMLNTELAADGALRMVSGEDVARAKRELPLSEEDSLAKATLDRLRVDPGADVVVLGSYTPLHGAGEKRIRLDIRLQDTLHGETIAERAFEGNEDDLFELVGQAGAALRQSLGAAPASSEAFAQARAALPKNPLAVKLYAEGKARIWAFNYIGAKELLIQAIAAEPDFPLSHSALADVWNHLGYATKARNEVALARALSEHLGPEEHLLVEGQYYSLTEDRPKAIEAYRKLFAQFPDNLDYGLRLADEQRWVNTEETLQTLNTLRRLPAPTGEDPRIDLIEARAWINQDVVKAQAAARLAIQKGTANGSKQLVSRGYGILCQILIGSSPGDALEVCEHPINKSDTGTAEDSDARGMNDLASLYYELGDVNRAEAMLRKAIIVFRQNGDVEGVTSASNNLGAVYLAHGNLSEAAQSFSDAIPGYREIGDSDGVALAFNNLAEVEHDRGDLGAALATYQQAKAAAKEIDDKHALAYVLNGVGDVLLDQGDLKGARNSYLDSLSLRKEIGEKQTVAETELSLAQLSLEESQPNDAESVIRKCKEEFHQDSEADDELNARVALVKAFLAEGKYSEAAKEANEAKPLSVKSGDELIRLRFDLAAARIESVSGDLKSPRQELHSALQEAHSHHLFGLELEARLALAELEKKSGERAAGQASLLSLKDAARSKGFGLMAVKASRSAAVSE